MKTQNLFVLFVFLFAAVLPACTPPQQVASTPTAIPTSTPILEVNGFKMGREEAANLVGGNPDDFNVLAGVMPALWTMRNFLAANPGVGVYFNDASGILAIITPEVSEAGYNYASIAFVNTNTRQLIDTMQTLRSVGYNTDTTIKEIFTEPEVKAIVTALRDAKYAKPANDFAVKDPGMIQSLKIAMDYIAGRAIPAGVTYLGYVGGVIGDILVAPVDIFINDDMPKIQG